MGGIPSFITLCKQALLPEKPACAPNRHCRGRLSPTTEVCNQVLLHWQCHAQSVALY